MALTGFQSTLSASNMTLKGSHMPLSASQMALSGSLRAISGLRGRIRVPIFISIMFSKGFIGLSEYHSKVSVDPIGFLLVLRVLY